MNKLIILSGVSGSGKTTLLNMIVEDGLCNAVTKYSDRKRFKTLDDITTVENLDDLMLKCDLVYKMYGNHYGFNSKEIEGGLKRKNQILITNDDETILAFREMFPNQVISVYILSDITPGYLKYVYMNRVRTRPINIRSGELAQKLKIAKNTLKNKQWVGLLKSMNSMDRMIDRALLSDRKFRLRVESIKKQEEKLHDLSAHYDYIVYNFYSYEDSTTCATQKAYTRLKEIVMR